MKSAKKSKILQGIYEENLYNVVRGERRSHAADIQVKNQLIIRIGSVVLSLVLSVAAISLSNSGNVSLANTTALKNTGAASSTNHNASTVVTLQGTGTEHLDRTLATAVPSFYVAGAETGGAATVRPPLQPNISAPDAPDMTLLNSSGISLVNLFGLGVKTIVIDPGHGGKDPGAIGNNSTMEKDVALMLARQLRKRLIKRGGYKVLLTRDDDTSMSLQERVRFANSKMADLFISIHVNAFSKAKRNFVETYYFGATEDTAVAELAARENAQSDYRYTDFKHMIQHISDTLKFQESKSLATYVQQSLYGYVKRVNKKTANHGIKPGPFVVLLGLEAPSILTEIANLSDKGEEKRLKSVKYRDNIAKFLEKGIVNYLNNSTTLGELR